MIPFTQPKFGVSAFNCPFCGAYSNHTWYIAGLIDNVHRGNADGYQFAKCSHCNQISVWFNDKMIYPMTGTAPLPNPDMPIDVKQDFEEARCIVAISPRGAAALLRLAIQKLCRHLGQSGENPNDDIGNLVKNGLPVKLQQALDSVRVVGNNAVHPGLIDLRDDVETANKLFVFINIICEDQISQPKQINDFYQEVIPDGAKQAIAKRDGK